MTIDIYDIKVGQMACITDCEDKTWIGTLVKGVSANLFMVVKSRDKYIIKGNVYKAVKRIAVIGQLITINCPEYMK